MSQSLMFRPSFGLKSTSRFRPLLRPAKSTLQCFMSPIFRPMPKSNGNPSRPITPIFSSKSTDSENSKPKYNSVKFEFSISSLISFLVGTCWRELVWKELVWKELTKTHIAYLWVLGLAIMWALCATGILTPSLEEEGFSVKLKNGLSARLGITKTFKEILELKLLYKKPKENDADDAAAGATAKDVKHAKEMNIVVESVTIHCHTVNVITSSDDSDTA